MHCNEEFTWKRLTRNVLIDLQKGLHLLKKPKKVFRSKYKVSYIFMGFLKKIKINFKFNCLPL